MATAEWELGDAGVQEIHVDAGVALTAADRAQIDIQIATAKQYPRDIVKSQRDAMALVSIDEETAGSMFYALPRKQAGKTIHIEGPSVRFAETLVYCWGNVRVEARVVAIDDNYITAQGTCLDLEKNVGGRIEVKRRITDHKGRRYSEDMITVTGNAACAIAYRNSVFKVIPGALAKKILDTARRVATGGAVPIETRRARALAWFARVGAPESRVLDLLGIETVDEITEDHLILLVGLKNAIQDGDSTVEQAFSGGVEKGPSAKAEELNDAIRQSAPLPEQKPDPATVRFEPSEKVEEVAAEPTPALDMKARYRALLGARGINGDTDRRALQKRLHAEGRVSAVSLTAWTDDDFAAAYAALAEIPEIEEED